MKLTSKKDFRRIVKGATFLASGGGGPFALGKSILDYYFSKKNVPSSINVNVVDSNDLKSTDWGCVAAGMGEPSRSMDLTPKRLVTAVNNAVLDMEELILRIEKENKRFKDFKSFNTLIPVEVGAVNITLPLIMALLNTKFSVVNGDPSGRSVPTIDLTTYATTQPVMPNMATSDGGDNFLVLSLDDYRSLGIAYSKLIDAGLVGIAIGLSLAPMNGKTIKNNNVVPGTVEDAYEIGKIFEKNITSEKRFEQIQTYLEKKSKSPRKMKKICRGKVIAYNTESVNDNDLGYLKIQTKQGRVFTIIIQNENILGQFDDETDIYITGPDSINYLSTKDGPLSANDMYENVLISEQFANNKDIELDIIAVEAPEVILNNSKLMKAWKSSYEINNYFGKYNSKLWSEK